MSASRYLLGSSLEDRVALTVSGAPALAQHAKLVELLSKRAPEAADLFAEPVLDTRDGQAPSRVSWYAPATEDPVPLDNLRTAQRLVAESALRSRLSALQPLFDDPAAAPLIRAALAVPTTGDILWTGSGPVLVNWGVVPSSVGTEPEDLARHFDATLGRFAPPGVNPYVAAAKPGAAAAGAAGAAMGAVTAPGGARIAPAAGGVIPPAPPAVPPAGPGARGPFGAIGAVLAAICIVLLLSLVALAAGYYYGWVKLAQEMQAGLPPARDPVLDEQLRRIQESVNDGLRRRIAELEGALGGDVCVALGPLPHDQIGQGGGGGQGPGGGQSRPQDGGLLTPPPQDQPVERPSERPGQPPEPTNLADLLDDSVVLVLAKIRRPDGREGTSMGTGFAIGSDTIVTNRHVIDNATPDGTYVISRKLGKLVSAEIVARTPVAQSPKPDYAVLRMQQAQLPALQVGTRADRLTPVVAVGFPGFVVETDDAFRRLMSGDVASTPSPVFTSGEVSSLQEFAGEKVLIHTAAITRGNSGGPLADRCGRVVGVNTFGRQENDTLYRVDYAQATSSLIAFLQANNIPFSSVDDTCRPAAAAAPQGGPQTPAPPAGQQEGQTPQPPAPAAPTAPGPAAPGPAAPGPAAPGPAAPGPAAPGPAAPGPAAPGAPAPRAPAGTLPPVPGAPAPTPPAPAAPAPAAPAARPG